MAEPCDRHDELIGDDRGPQRDLLAHEILARVVAECQRHGAIEIREQGR